MEYKTKSYELKEYEFWLNIERINRDTIYRVEKYVRSQLF